MKAPNFAYARPSGLGEALRLLAQFGDAAVPLAGGQSLLALLNLRLSSPQLLVDIGGLDQMKDITVADGIVRIGALVTHTQILESPIVSGYLPLLSEAIKHVAHVAIRNRGTIGGSMAFADPAAELPACAVVLDASLLLATESGQREVAAETFFKGPLETDLNIAELITEIRFPCQPTDDYWAFLELAQRSGDLAAAGIAIVVSVAGQRIERVRSAYFGCVDRPKLAGVFSQRLIGEKLPPLDLGWVSASIGSDFVFSDSPGWRASTKFRLATVLTSRALRAMHCGGIGAPLTPMSARDELLDPTQLGYGTT